MYITCKCLNVSIKTKGNELHKVNNDELELTAEEQADAFFKCELATTKDLENIIKVQPVLVEIKNVGSWAIHKCYNCMMFTHAVHKEHGAALVLINTNLITSEEEIEKLKTSPNFSLVFRIVIDHNKIIDDLDPLERPTKFSVSQLSSNLRLALGGLEEQLEVAIRRESTIVHEKIRQFTLEQYQILENFKERAHTDHSFLARLICSEHQTGGTNNLETPPATPETVQPNKPTSMNDVVDTTARLPSKNTVLRQHSSSKSKNSHAVNGNSNNDMRIREPSSYDGEALFMLEGMDDTPLAVRQLQASDQESDTDDSGNEIHIPRSQRSGHPTLAKSLPVTVPAFHSFGQRSIHDDDDEQISRDPMDPHNIQASIKALAKSVHGDTVFGDLPRPRFSTQI